MLRNDPASWDSFFSRFYWLFAKGASLYPSRRRCENIFSNLKLNKDNKIIEMGCGTAFFLKRFKKKGFKNLYGLDYSHNMLKRLGDTDINPVYQDIRDLKLDPRSFDLVFSDGLVEHFENPLSILLNFSHIASKYLITIVPRKTLSNKIQNFILRPPKEYNRSDEEWIKLHQKIGFDKIEWHILGRNCLMIICSRDI